MIEKSLDDGILTLRLAHGKASALDIELLEALIGELDAARTSRAVILTGTGSIFSAGVDLFRLTGGDPHYVPRFLALLSDFVEAYFALPTPVVAAVNGHAIAGGCVITLGADYRLMARGTGRIGIPELLVGVPFPAAPLEVVRFAVPRTRVQSLIYLGKTLLPEEALTNGLIDETVDAERLDDRARDVARSLATIPEAAFRLTKSQLRREASERMARFREHPGSEMYEAWSSPATHGRIKEYLARTVHSGRGTSRSV